MGDDLFTTDGGDGFCLSYSGFSQEIGGEWVELRNFDPRWKCAITHIYRRGKNRLVRCIDPRDCYVAWFNMDIITHHNLLRSRRDGLKDVVEIDIYKYKIVSCID